MNLTSGWAVTFAMHVWPLGDLIRHEHSPDCPCQPDRTEYDLNGELCFRYTHHSLDGRERCEAA